MTDRNHCGGCGAPCAAGEICEVGSCQISCPASQIACGAACVDTASDPAHCGACGTSCSSGQVCSDSLCGASCRDGLIDCGGACVDTTTHPDHCGACDAACTAPTGATPVCIASSCRAVCDALMGDCNADLGAMTTDGCETTLGTDPANCGACGRACSFAHSVGGCAAGVCTVAMCDTDYGDCDGVVSNGCETRLTDDDLNCAACGTVCPMGESCVAGMCRAVVGDTCSNAITLMDGANTVAWTAFSTDYLTAAPSCGSGYTPTGPDLVLRYTASADVVVTLAFTKPASTRWHAVVSTEACGSLATTIACMSEFTATTMTGSFHLGSGQTAYIYVVDTTSGTLPLDNPLTVNVSSIVPPCTPGMGGLVGTTTARVPTGVTTTFSEYYVAADQNPTGFVYVGGTSVLYRLPKAGGTVQDVAAAASLTSTTHLGYEMVIDGNDIYVLNDTTTGTTGKLWRISTNGGTTWTVQDYATFPTAPGDDLRGATVYGGRIYMVTDESSSANTEVWSVPTGATTLPVTATLELSFGLGGLSYCDGIARDTTYYYFACYTSDQIVRVPIGGGTYELITDMHPTSITKATLSGVDTTSDGVYDILYMQSGYEAIYYVCGPASGTPFSSVLVDFGGASSNFGLGLDRVANTLWAFDDDTREFVSVR